MAAAAGRRAIAPRLASIGARSANALSKVVDNVASLPIKYQRQLTGSPAQIAATHALLFRTDPEYQALLQNKPSGLSLPGRGKLNLPKERNP